LEDRDMNNSRKVKKKSRLALSIVLIMALVLNGNLLSEAHGVAYVATIGSANYQTLDEAITAVEEGQTIRLLQSVEIKPDTVDENGATIKGESGIVNKPDTSFYLDMGGFDIFGNKAGAILQVDAGNVTIYNGKITNSNGGGLAVSSNVLLPIGGEQDLTGYELVVPAAYQLQFTKSANGSIRYDSAEGLEVPANLCAVEGSTFNFYFVPDVGYEVDSFTINGVAQTASTQYYISNLTQNEEINVSFDKITFTIAPVAYANNTVAKLGFSVAPTPVTVEYGGSATLTYTVRNGFKLLDVQVNDVSIGAVTTIELNNITTPQNVKVILEKTALFIMLDAGHFEYYNHSPVLSSYYEGNTMWIYHQYLEKCLEQYPNIIVDTTRINNSRALGEALQPSQRGAKGEGYDLVLSVHSNAASTSSADHPVAIYTLDPRYSEVSRTLGLKLATKVAEVMKTYEPAKVYSKAQSDGRDWYGVNRGAADVGVPSIILEHSFHTNYRATVWLSQDANLRALAVAEAKVIADYYGIPAGPPITPPATPLHLAVSQRAYNSLVVHWDLNPNATGYEVYRSTSPTSGFIKIATTSNYYYLNGALTTGKAYYYKVRAYKTAGIQTVYSGFTSVLGSRPLPATPVSSVVAGVDKATISWSYVPGASGYQIYRAYGTSSTYYKVKTVYSSGTLRWTNYGRTTGKIYTYKVRAYRVVYGRYVYGNFSAPKSVRVK
jgi:N-acetylmuramoyl-L-alanine amidase